MESIKIIATGRALPKKIVSNDALCETVDSSDEWIRTRTGILQRYCCESETCLDLAEAAAQKALEKAGIDRNQIGVIVVATTTPTYAFPSMACMLQQRLGAGEEMLAFDINAACSGFLYGLEICKSLLHSSKKKYALLVGSEELSRILDYEDRSTCVLFGDGAAAAVLTLSEGIFYHRAWARGNDEALVCEGVGYPNPKLKMQGNAVFRFAVTVIQQAVEQILQDANLQMDDVDYVICHQANSRIIEHVRKKYPGQEEKFVMNIDRYANTSAASIPLVLDELFENGMLKEGMKVICVGFGAGFTWSSTLFSI